VKKTPIPSADGSSVLVVTDFSDSSLQAFQWAIPEAQIRRLSISVLYPYRLDSLRHQDNPPTSKKELDHEARLKFEQVAQGLLLSSRVPFDFRSEVGFLRDRISDFAKKHEVAMVVMDSQMAQVESFPEFLAELAAGDRPFTGISIAVLLLRNRTAHPRPQFLGL
jgi:nucleotide-binding universal stress UspA family protein